MAAEQGQPNSREIELVLGQLEAIPPLSPVATRVLTLTNDESTKPAELVRLIETDPGLTARLLSLLGRAESGVRAGAVNIDNAVKLLGFKTIRHVTLALKVQEAFGIGETDHERGSPFDRLAFWKHCLAVACAAQALAESTDFKFDPHEAFVCGLLHDLGKIALHTALPKSYAKVVAQTDELRSDIGAIERRLLGVDHTIAGQRLAARWGLPQTLVDCIWLHHQTPEALPANIAVHGHVQLVILADTIAREQHLGWSGNFRIGTSSRELADRIGIDRAILDRVNDELADAIDARSEWIGGERIDAKREYLTALLKMTDELTRHDKALRLEVLQHRRKERLFNAVLNIVSETKSADTVRDTCARTAATLGPALGATGCLIAVTNGDDWIDAGAWVEGESWADAATDANIAGYLRGNNRNANRPTSNTTANDPPVKPSPAVERHDYISIAARFGRGRFGASLRTIPFALCESTPGCILFERETSTPSIHEPTDDELRPIVTAVSAIIAQAQARAASLNLTDELADAGRRAGEAQRDAANRRLVSTVTAMAAGAAHELNNPLAVISGRAQALEQRIEDDAAKKSLASISAHAKSASDIVAELMAFAQTPLPTPSEFDVKGCINEVAAELGADELWAGDNTGDNGDALPPVRFDRDRLRDALREILTNAIDATAADTRRLTVKAAFDPAEDQVVVSVIDNGRGMTADVLGRAMDPFFSHRPAGRGRGMGLARVRRWMLLGGGDVELESKPDAGTRVVLRLPAASNGC